MSDPIRIVIADDHAILRSGLRLLLSNQPDFEVIGEAENGLDALKQLESLHPDLLLLDLNMPQATGLEVLAQAKTLSPETRILVLTMHDDSANLRQALGAGASGYVLKKAVDSELVMAIRAVIRGELFIHSSMTRHLIPGNEAESPIHNDDPWKQLSERELEVVKRVAQGYTNAEIAQELYLSPKTVETYRARGMEKLAVETRAQLVKLALKFGYLND
ncbi:MAG: response regulator transcription factor [Anaerolineae bacterium]|nr:response regulator transcription factor [Anaerolineae bacterium]